MKWRELDPFLRAFWHRPVDYLPCGNSPFAVSLFPLPWMIPDRSSPSWRFRGQGRHPLTVPLRLGIRCNCASSAQG